MKEENIITSRASTALYCLLKVINVKNKFIIFPNIICSSVVFAAIKAGVNIKFCDVNPYDGNLNIESLNLLIKKNANKIFSIVVPHMYGLPAKIDLIKNICKKNNIYLIEDCAQSLGSYLNKKPTGSFGDCSIFSFGYSKNIDVGSGGCISTDDKTLQKELSNIYSQLTPFNIAEHNKLKILYRKKYINHINKKNNIGFIKKLDINLFSKLFVHYSEPHWIYKAENEFNNFKKIKETKINNYNFYKDIFEKKIKYIKINKNIFPWRFNMLINPKKRNYFICELWNIGLHANKMYPSVSNFMFNKRENSTHSSKFEKKIINLPIDADTMTKEYKIFFKKKIKEILLKWDLK